MDLLSRRFRLTTAHTAMYFVPDMITKFLRRFGFTSKVSSNKKSHKSHPDFSIIPAVYTDAAFLTNAYLSAASDGAVASQPNTDEYISRSIAVSQRELAPQMHPHPFASGQPRVYPLDDLFVLKKDDIPVGVLWLRDYNDFQLLESAWFGELIFLWIQPEFRGLGVWPLVSEFAKKWAVDAKKSHLMGRCRKPSRRMAELFERSGFTTDGVTPSGMSVHTWRC
ncbi:GNAT family N-acetyltransferase [Rugamonas apoptosis]|uniref:GNAT family N-acetyltransferase n=1 Tax=Rugamonas apoptosis TaxID=2758570 RepID=A0A7W2F739_9BURK|nr:GNAT family N-acetyltransferase [Rugamonas apoptosis]MBA5686333.1 GNAT family N-acetyltransferase [Rugamonas apoptosis]